MSTSRTGQVLGDRYELGHLLGSGAVAEVYEAYDRLLERPVAVKLLRRDWAADPATVAAFEQEAQLAAGLHHPHLAQVYDAGAEGGQGFIVMERVPGTPLDTAAPANVGQALDIAAQVAGALAFVHEHGLLHCDVKPANVLVSPSGQAKLVDFGGARALDAAEAPDALPAAGSTLRLPLVGVSPGALPYLAPERLAGAPPSPAADVYALGAVFYAMLAGRPPYVGDTFAAIRQAHQAGPPPPLADLNPAVPPAVAALVMRAIAPDPGGRFASAAEMESALTELRDGAEAVPAGLANEGGVAQQAGGVTPFLPAAAAVAAPPAVLAAPGATPISPSAPTVAAAVAVRAPVAAPPPPAWSPTAPVAAPVPYAAYPPAAAPLAARRPAGLPRWALPALAAALLLGLLSWFALSSSAGRQGVAASAATATGAAPPTAALARKPAPQFVGLTLDQARAAAQQDGWHLVEAPGVYNNSVASGLIMGQLPEAGTVLAADGPITVTASLGPAAPTQPANNSGGAPPAQPATSSGNQAPTQAPRGGSVPPPAQHAAPAPPAKDKGNDKGKDNNKGKGKDH